MSLTVGHPEPIDPLEPLCTADGQLRYARAPIAPVKKGPLATPELSDVDTLTGGHVLVCRVCRNPVTVTRERISILGAHAHDRVNPSGFMFRIGCFREAPGAVSIGTPSAEFPWFPGYLWQVALCRGCFEHIGWFFSGSDGFYGLILERLVEESRPETS